jgi:uncharacterized membrane protein
MATSQRSTLIQAIGLGVLAGMRSLSAPAVVSQHLSHHHAPDSLGTPLNFLAKPQIANLLKVPAAGELVLDKLPMTPSRIEFPAIFGRIGSGAVVGATLYRAHGKNLFIGLVVGALSALASTYAAYYLRRTLGEQFDIPDLALGIAEDALVVAGSLALLRNPTD